MTEMPTGWALAQLNDLVGTDGVFCDGDWVESKDQDPQGAVRLTQLADVGEGVWRNRSSRYLTSATAERLRCTYLEVGDVLVARMPDPLGRACQFPGDPQTCVTVVDVAVLRPGEGSVSARWLMWAINAPQVRRQIDDRQSGTTRKRISRRHLGEVQLGVPPAPEQERIVAAIEEAFSLLDAGETALHNTRTRLKRMRDSVLTAAITGQLVPQDPTDTPALDRLSAAGCERQHQTSGAAPVGWATAPLSELLAETIGGVWGSDPGADEVDVRVIRVTEMRPDGTLDPTTAAERSIKLSQLKSRQLRNGDLLLEKSGGGPTRPVGRVGMVRALQSTSVCANFMQLLRADERLMTPAYLEVLLRAFHVVGGTAALQTATTNIRNLKMKDYFAQIHAVPPLEEQVRIVAVVERQFSFIEAAERAVDAGLARSKGLRRSVLKAAFEGRLVEQDPADEPASVLLERIAEDRTAAVPRKRRPGRVRGKVVAS